MKKDNLENIVFVYIYTCNRTSYVSRDGCSANKPSNKARVCGSAAFIASASSLDSHKVMVNPLPVPRSPTKYAPLKPFDCFIFGATLSRQMDTASSVLPTTKFELITRAYIFASFGMKCTLFGWSAHMF